MVRIVEWVMKHRVGIGVLLFAAGLGATVVLAFRASSASPPDGAQSSLLVVIAGMLNLGGAWAVSRRPGDPNLTASRMAARHLANITTEAGVAKELAEKAFESRASGKAREDIGPLSWRLSEIESRLIDNQLDWAKAYPDLVESESDEDDKRRDDD